MENMKRIWLSPEGYEVEHPDGEWVKYEDYAALQQKLDSAQALAEVARDMNGVVKEGFAKVVAERDALAAENAYLLPKAASELSNAWVLHKYWVGIQAALMHLRVGRMYEVEQWLQNTVAGPGIEAPNLKLTDEIEAWATEQSKDSISHTRALEIMKAETPATDGALDVIRAEGIIMFASKQLAAAGDLDSTITLERLMLDAEEFAGQLRAGNAQHECSPDHRK